MNNRYEFKLSVAKCVAKCPEGGNCLLVVNTLCYRYHPLYLKNSKQYLFVNTNIQKNNYTYFI